MELNQRIFIQLNEFFSSLISNLKRFFNAVTIWVTDLSWMKFFLFAIVLMVIGAITQDMISKKDQKIIISKSANTPSGKVITNRNTEIEINDSGINIKKNKKLPDAKAAPSAPPAPPLPPGAVKAPDSGTADASASSEHASIPSDDEINVRLPPGVSEDISNAIDEAVADASEQEVTSYRKEKTDWLMSLIMISLVSLFGIKALMGGKRRAEILAEAAQEDAEKQALHRQVAEAKMQMMQAQIEPHFLFNTLASVEHLIETDPPRASAMQRSLIQYLRAVIPQVRENTSNTNLGREVAIVKEYLTLLQMRMEERLEYSITIPEGLSSATFPTMMLQTLVENSIKHGLEPKAEGGKISINAEVAHSKLRVCVSDNGLGFGAVPSNGTGLGLQNIRERLALFYQGNYQFIITPNNPGVAVTIEIPYQVAKA
jgi:hypothetical protein